VRLCSVAADGSSAGIRADSAAHALILPAPAATKNPIYPTLPILTSSGNFRLSPGSPCIDTGDPAFAPAPAELDLDGHVRRRRIRHVDDLKTGIFVGHVSVRAGQRYAQHV
jgi:hypothetical protein